MPIFDVPDWEELAMRRAMRADVERWKDEHPQDVYWMDASQRPTLEDGWEHRGYSASVAVESTLKER